MQTQIERVKAACDDLKKGKMIILTDHPEREDEGDIIFPAEIINKEVINFMIRNGSGIICMPLFADHIKRLGLKLMVSPDENTSQKGTPFTVSIEARYGVSTGVSAEDRTKTILTAINDNVTENDIVKPGHIFPLQAKQGGVLERPGHTEGAIDLVRLAGFKPAAVLCEVMNPDGSMAKGQKLIDFANQHDIKILSINDLITYRLCHETLIDEQISAHLPLENYGEFTFSVVKEKISKDEHLVLRKGDINLNTPTLVRIHSSCITGDLFHSKRCDCYNQLHFSLQKISKEGGILIYLNQEGRGIGLFNKIKAYALQEQQWDTVEANQQLGLPVDSRNYALAAHILHQHQVKQVRLLTNNPNKVEDLKKYGIENVVREMVPVFHNDHNYQYLKTKKEKLNHDIAFDDDSFDK